jgi:hypothetical protein
LLRTARVKIGDFRVAFWGGVFVTLGGRGFIITLRVGGFIVTLGGKGFIVNLGVRGFIVTLRRGFIIALDSG